MSKTYANAKAALQADPQTYASTIAGQLERIDDSKVVIVNKLHAMTGLATDSLIDDAALNLEAITVVSSGSAQIAQGQSYTVPEGYYNGTFQVIADGQGQDLQAKSVTWNKTTYSPQTAHTITPDNGYYGLASVSIPAIPADYQDVTIVSAENYATAANILTGKSVVGRDGNVIAGSMTNNGAISEVLTAHKTSGTYDDYTYTVPAGYHNGSGTVSISLETVNVTPTESAQTINPTSGKVIGEVSVAAIDKPTYLTSWTSDATAAAGDILTTKTAYVNGTKVSGSMVNNSSTWDGEQSTPISHVLTTATGQTSITVPAGYHNGYGVVSVDPEDKTVSWSDITSHSSAWTLSATSGKVLRTINLPAKPANWVDTTTSTGAAAGDILASKVAFVNGASVTGTIATVTNYTSDVTDEILATGASGGTLDSFNEAFYKNGGTITIGTDLYDSLAAI